MNAMHADKAVLIEKARFAGLYQFARDNPSLDTWRALAYRTGFIADRLQDEDPDSLDGVFFRSLSQKAWEKAIELAPPKDEADYDSLSGVLIGWFRGMFKGAKA